MKGQEELRLSIEYLRRIYPETDGADGRAGRIRPLRKVTTQRIQAQAKLHGDAQRVRTGDCHYATAFARRDLTYATSAPPGTRETTGSIDVLHNLTILKTNHSGSYTVDPIPPTPWPPGGGSFVHWRGHPRACITSSLRIPTIICPVGREIFWYQPPQPALRVTRSGISPPAVFPPTASSSRASRR